VKEKTELLEEIKYVINKKKDLDVKYLLTVLFSIILAGTLIFPKIYIQQQIYFISRDITKLKSEFDILKEENKFIDRSVETIKFKNQIINTISEE
jgi:cell division protein FtsL